MNRGDLVRLKAPEQGRYCEGKLLKKLTVVTKWGCQMDYI